MFPFSEGDSQFESKKERQRSIKRKMIGEKHYEELNDPKL